MALAVLGASLSACVSDVDGDDSEFVERDSSGIVIASTPGTVARRTVAWQVDTVPELEISAIGDRTLGAAQPAREFYRIGGVRELPDGRVVVVDGGTREVGFFDSRGRFLSSFGGSGQGPGEFGGNPVLVTAFENDSLVLFDPRPTRFYFLSNDADGYRLVRPEQWRGATPPVGFIEPYVLVELMHLQKPTTTGEYAIPLTYAWTDMVTGERIVIDSFTVRRQYTVRFVNNVAYGGIIPFSSMPSAALTRDGALVTGGMRPEIRQYDLQGKLRRIIRIVEEPRRTSDADIERYAEVTGKPIDPDIPVPDTMPAFQALLVDEEGWFWANVYDFDPSHPRVWVVFDRDGRAHGSVTTPAALRIHQIASTFVIGVWTDELGVEQVRKYRLNRRRSTD